MAHRDYHAENLIWLPERDGAARVGMIDFQDAVRGPPVVGPALPAAGRPPRRARPSWRPRRWTAISPCGPSVDRDAFLRDYAGLAALNEARILGIFARLIARDGKPRYAAFMPRMWAHLNANLKTARPGGRRRAGSTATCRRRCGA